MSEQGALVIFGQGERELVMTRAFNAPRRLVFEAWTRPELLKRWLGVFGGWTLAVCEIDLRVGGTYRYEWHNADRAARMGVGGVYREIEAPGRFVVTERFDEPWYPGEALITTVLTEQEGRTTMTSTIRYETAEARDAVLRSPMEQGVTMSYDALAEVLATLV